MRRALVLVAALVWAAPAWAQSGPGASGAPVAPGPDPVVIGTKPFAESYVLGELFATLLEARGIAVERRPGLGSTEIVFQALRQGEVDVYPEYTGTGLVVILDREAEGGAGAVWRQVSRDFRERFDLHWVAPLGFENSYALAVRRATADSLDLTTLGDLARVAPGLVAGLSPDFIGRPDGLPGLRSAYDLRFAETRPLLQAVKYRALANGEVDLIDGYSTDGALDRWNLVVLEDDRDFFPPYAAAPLVTGDLFRERPDVIRTLSELAGRLDEATMRRLNRRVEVDGDAPARVAVEALAELGLVAGTSTATAAPDPADGDGLAAYLWARRHRTLALTARHLHLVGVSLLAALAVALPLGLALERRRSGAEAVIRAVGLLQTLPSIALLAFMIPLLGIGVVPAVAALFLYSLFPIVRNTYTGVRDADPTAVAAARALGMTEGQILLRVRLPLAAPVLLAGVRTAAVINVGTATLAAFIGAGGLGDPIVAGLALSDTPLILSGALPAAVLALVVDLALHRVEGWLTPEGLEG